ncbi:MAG TPA: hypothetical protein VFS41_10160 [Edaphobacter sp.]|nr:hypothetical protein [Edaphobacter sp.]
MSSLKMIMSRFGHHEMMPDRCEQKGNYFELHPLVDVIRGLLYTSVLWGLLAVGVYSVYCIILAAQ